MSVSHYGGDMVNFKDQPFVVAGRDTLIAETLVTLADGDPGWRATEKIPGLKQRYLIKKRSKTKLQSLFVCCDFPESGLGFWRTRFPS